MSRQDFSLQPLNFDAALDKIDSAQSLVKSLDSPEVAIEFVLALEHPCMTHIQHPLDSHLSDPSGHVHMASAPLFSNAPRQPKPNTTWNWTANGSVIKELLNLSASINLEGEITPVEAWHRLRQHPNFWRLDLQGVENLKNELSMMVRCCGYGILFSFGRVMVKADFGIVLELFWMNRSLRVLWINTLEMGEIDKCLSAIFTGLSCSRSLFLAKWNEIQHDL